MQINVSFDQNPATLPAGFVAAVDYVVNYFDSTFTNPVTVNIDVGYGEIAGQSLGTDALGESETYIDSVAYSQALAALKANQPSPTQQAAYSTLPATSPLPGGNPFGGVPGESLALEQFEPTFGQDLNGDGFIGVTKRVIQTDAGTSLTLVAGQNYYLFNSSGSGPSLKLAGADVVANQMGPWSPIGAVQTATGYDVAWKASDGQYTIWFTDSNGNYLNSPFGAVSGTNLGLEQFESTFGQDINGDGTIGVTKQVIQTDAGTSLTLVASQNYYLLDSSGSGPSLKLAGADVVANQMGPWSPIGAVQTATGYDVAWKTSDGQYTVWFTDSNGNYLSSPFGAVSGTSLALEQYETTFGQDLNGDKVIGVVGATASSSTFTSVNSARTPTLIDIAALSGALTLGHSAETVTLSAATSTPGDAAQTTRLAVLGE
jgi:hypothetical protein